MRWHQDIFNLRNCNCKLLSISSDYALLMLALWSLWMTTRTTSSPPLLPLRNTWCALEHPSKSKANLSFGETLVKDIQGFICPKNLCQTMTQNSVFAKIHAKLTLQLPFPETIMILSSQRSLLINNNTTIIGFWRQIMLEQCKAVMFMDH